MPVWLDSIPPMASKITRPNTRRWLVILLVILLIGFVLTLWFWKKERAGFIFWFTAVGLPICFWGVIFGLRRMAYKMQQISATTWDRERKALIESEIKRGQRFAYLLETYVETPVGQGAGRNLSAITQSIPIVALQTNRSNNSHIRYAPLAIFDQADFDAVLFDCMNNIVKKITPVLKKIAPDIPCYYLVEIDSTFQIQANHILLDILKKQHSHEFHLISGQGMDAIDAWLDTRWNIPSLLLIVSIGYYSEPVENDGEAISCILLSNRPSIDIPDRPRFHRPEKSELDKLSYGLSQAILWANLASETITGCWVSGSKISESGEWNQACEENKLQFSLTKDNKVIDSILGNTSRVSPWIATALAEASLNQTNSPNAQLIAVQPQPNEDNIWVTVVSRHKESKESTTHV